MQWVFSYSTYFMYINLHTICTVLNRFVDQLVSNFPHNTYKYYYSHFITLTNSKFVLIIFLSYLVIIKNECSLVIVCVHNLWLWSSYASLRSLLCSGNRAHRQLTGHQIARVLCARAAYLSAFTCFYTQLLLLNFSVTVLNVLLIESKRTITELQVSYRHLVLIGR